MLVQITFCQQKEQQGFSSGLGTNDFLRRTTFVQCNEHNLNDLGKHAEILAEAEGLDAHRMSIRMLEERMIKV